MQEEELAIQLPLLQDKIPYDEDVFGDEDNWELILNDLLTDSKSILLETLYPFDDDLVIEETPIPPKYYNWQLRCCVELYNMADKQGVVNYSENGLSWSKLVDGLSNSLMNKLNSHVGIPKSSKDDESGE